MNLSAVDILAGILIALSTVKLVAILVNVRAWARLVKRLYANPDTTSRVALALAAVALYLLLRSGLRA